MSTYTPSTTTTSPPSPFLLIFHAFLSFVICNIDRINLSIAIIPLSHQYNYPPTIQGQIQAAFFVGYMTTQILGGILADRFTGIPILAIGVFVWSLSTIFTPLAANISLLTLLLIRIVLGVGEGVAMPAMNAIVAAFVPHQLRARALSFIYSGMYAGSILGLATAPSIMAKLGWPAVFYIFGAIGVVWVVVFLFTTRGAEVVDQPVKYEPIPKTSLDSHQFLAHIEQLESDSASASQSQQGKRLPTVWEMIRHRCVLALIVAHFCCTWGYFILLTWLPTYLYSRFELKISESAFLSAAPWVAMFAFSNLSGTIADRMIERGVDVTYTRKLMQAIGFAGRAVFLALLRYASNAYVAMALVSSGLALASFSNSGVYATHQDIGPSVAGTLLGISNTFASLPGIIGVYVTGVILDKTQNNWNIVFATAIGFDVLGLIVYVAFATSKRQW